MTTQILKKLAKKANVNLQWCDSVLSNLNSRGTFINTIFYATEVCGGKKINIYIGGCSTSLSAVLKREEFDDDYYTDGIQWISDIRTN